MNESPIRQQLSDGNLDEYASSDTQRRYRAAVVEHGSIRAAADALGISRGTLSESVNRLVKRAAQRGYAPAHGQSHPAPPGQSIRGVSTLYNAAGEVQAQWVKTKASPEDLHEQLRVFVEELRTTAPRAEPARPPLNTADDTLAVYPIGDPHMGMFAWREEGGEDFDLKIATRDMRRAVDVLMDATPASNTAVVLPLGDFLHGDNSDNATPKSGNSLDVDTRYAKVLRAGARLMLDVVHTALRRHHQVIVRMVRGNHDPESSLALALILDAHFSDEPRVKVDLSSSAFWYHRFGSTLIGSTHGDTAKIPDLGAIMAADRPEDWGATKHRVWFTGHRHNRQVTELTGGVIVEVARTLAPKDAWHAAQGYRSGRDIQSVVFHRKWGEVERHTVGIDRVRGEQ